AGVYGTLTGDEVALLTDPFFQISSPPGAHLKDYCLAVGKARFVGEPVAAVVANTRETARDAAELVEVDYEPLPVITDARQALADAAPVLHDEAGTNLTWEGVYEWGDLDQAFAEADRVLKISELHFDRFNSTPLECDGALVEYNRGTAQWTIITNNQFPGFAAIMMGPAMRVGLDKLRFVTQDIGGGFGNKITSHPQLVACCLLARKLRRPVQWTEWRTDFHLSMSHGNELGLDPVEVRKRNYIRTEEMPYETPNGCIYDSGDYAKMLDTALELAGYDGLAERRADAERRGKLLGVGIGSTLDSGTNNFGQPRLIESGIQLSGKNEAPSTHLAT